MTLCKVLTEVGLESQREVPRGVRRYKGSEEIAAENFSKLVRDFKVVIHERI